MTLVLYSGSQQVARLDVGERDVPPPSVWCGNVEYRRDHGIYRKVVAQVEGNAVPAAADNAREKDEVAGGL